MGRDPVPLLENVRVPGLLEGIRVLDFGRFIAGPYAAMMLADFGADVIRIERQEGGEDRWLGPVTEDGEGGLFLNINRNKRGLAIDLGHPRAAEIITRLVRQADVVIANLPFEVLAKLRLDYDSLKATKPDIILLMASTFGPEGPYRDRVGFDALSQAMSGAMSLTGSADLPTRSLVPWADYGTALHGAFGVMAALLHRDRTGEGQVIDVSLLATGTMFMTQYYVEHSVAGIRRQRQGNTAFYTAPSDTYRTRDGWIMVPTIGDPMFRRWARLMEREDLIDDPRCANDITRANNASLINDVMARWCVDKTSQQAIAILEAARIPCGPVYDVDEALADPQVVARKLFQDVSHAHCDKPIPISRPAVRLSESPGEIRHRAPAVGEHTAQVLAEVGYTSGEIAELCREEVVSIARK